MIKHQTAFSFICKKFYVSQLLDKIGLRGTQSDTRKLVNKLKEEVIDGNITLSSKFDLEVQNGFKTLPIMYWLQMVHKTPTGARFYCSI